MGILEDIIIGISKDIVEVRYFIERFSLSSVPVLIRGESGTGKGLVAGAIYEMGGRCDRPLVKVVCSVTDFLTDEIIKEADRGTLFLDEVWDLKKETQRQVMAILLKNKDVRIIATTNRDMEQFLAEGIFRKDLYYRLKVGEIYIPPLRDRREDIPLLVNYFTRKLEKKYRRKVEVSSEVFTLFNDYNWPGNIRELENVLEHSFLVSKGSVLDVKVLPAEMRGKSDKDEGIIIKRILSQNGYNKAETARILGLSRQTLYRKMKKYGL